MSQDLKEEEEQAEEEAGPRLPPIAYPLLALLFGGVLVWSFSRVLLAVTQHEAVAVATLMAANILVGSALVAYGSRVRGRPVAYPLLVGAGVAVISAGLVASVVFGDRGPGEKAAAKARPGGAAGGITVTAQGIKFLETKLTAKAGKAFSIRFVNNDAATPHNVDIYSKSPKEGGAHVAGANGGADTITGPGQTMYEIKPLKPGAYFFQCDIHPLQMTGTLTVTPS